MENRMPSQGAQRDAQFLGLMLELNELKHERSARLLPSLAFVWMLLGFVLGAGLVMIWAG